MFCHSGCHNTVGIRPEPLLSGDQRVMKNTSVGRCEFTALYASFANVHASFAKTVTAAGKVNFCELSPATVSSTVGPPNETFETKRRTNYRDKLRLL